MNREGACVKRTQPEVEDDDNRKKFKPSEDWAGYQDALEDCMAERCLCKLPLQEVVQYLGHLINQPDVEDRLVLAGFFTWLGHTFHDDLLTGMVCSRIQGLINHFLSSSLLLDKFRENLLADDEHLKYCSCQAITALLPMSFCGQDIALDATEIFLKDVIKSLKFTKQEDPSLPGATNHLPDLSAGLFGVPPAVAGLGDDFDVEESPEESQGYLSESNLDEQSMLIRILNDLVSHGGKQREDNPGQTQNTNCQISELEDEMLCQEFQVKCTVIKNLEPVWEKFTKSISDRTLKSSSEPGITVASGDATVRKDLANIAYVTEGFKLWKSLISIKANLNFVESRSFAANLSHPIYSLQASSPACVWRSALDTVSECLCYGSTLGLQSIPPEEPCQLAHTLIRLVRFEGFLRRVPFSQSLGFGGISGEGTSFAEDGEDDNSHGYDRGIVQKMVIIILKAVALTTREARVDSSSGESDSSLSSRESGSSCSSDLVIIERNMSGMYKQLDNWIKSILPVLPDSDLQDNLLHLLQEQDDVLIEGLLCLLDTHIALHVPGRDTQGLFDTCPTAGFIKFISIVGGDPSVLLDFLVSNETCFLLYLLRYLKFVVKDWPTFVSTCGEAYTPTLAVILQLKTSIHRLLNKELFPYNIGPVYKLLEKVENLSNMCKS